MDISSFGVQSMPLARKHIAGGFTFLILAPATVAIVLRTSIAFMPISLVVLAFYTTHHCLKQFISQIVEVCPFISEQQYVLFVCRYFYDAL